MMNTLLKTIFLSLLLFSSSFSNELKTINLQLQWKHQFQFAGYYIALEKGFYKDSSLDVNILEYDYGINIVKKVLENQVQFGIGRSSLILNKSKGDDIVLNASIFQSSPHVLMGLKSKIKSIKEIKNKKVMFTGDAFDDALIISMLSNNGINFKDLKVVPHSFDVNDLISGKTDLMSSYISNEPHILSNLGYETIIFDPKDFGFDFYNDILFTSHKFLSKNPGIVDKFVEASLKGWKYAFNNIEETVNLIYKKYNTQNKSKEALTYEANELKKLAYHNTNKLGDIDKNKIQKIYEYYRLLGLIQKPVNLQKFVHELDNNKYTYIEQEYMENKKIINYCIDPNWMPFEMIDENNKHIGMTSDYIKLFEENLNLKFNLVNTNSWLETLEKAKLKECDILTAVMETEDRKEYLNFTTSYLKIPLVLTSKLNTQFINNISDIKDKKIAITKGYAYDEILRKKYPYLEIIEVESIDEGLQKVVNGEVYAYAGTLASIGHKFQTKYSGELKIIAKLDYTWDLSLGIKKDDSLLLEIMQKTLNEISEEEKKDIFNKWVSIKYESRIDYKLLGTALIFFLLIIGFFVYKQMLMRKFNRQLEDLLIEKTKSAQMGEMIDSIAHQWKQPLNLISIKNSELKYLSDIDHSLITNEFITEITDDIHEQIEHLAETTDEFRRFFRQDIEKENVYIYETIESVIKLNRDLINQNEIDITLNEEEKLNYELIETEFKHVFINLISNAKDAFIENKIEDRKIEINISKNEYEIEIEIKDNAGGIPLKIIDSIFEPHVTTKEKSKGTGIGLYMTNQILQKIEGKITVSNYEENGVKGAIFKIKLPL